MPRLAMLAGRCMELEVVLLRASSSAADSQAAATACSLASSDRAPDATVLHGYPIVRVNISSLAVFKLISKDIRLGIQTT